MFDFNQTEVVDEFSIIVFQSFCSLQVAVRIKKLVLRLTRPHPDNDRHP